MVNKVRLVLGMAMGEADSGDHLLARMTPVYARGIAIDGIKASMRCRYIDMDTVSEIREEAHRLVDRMCDVQERNYGK
jgi:hypothetical protein